MEKKPVCKRRIQQKKFFFCSLTIGQTKTFSDLVKVEAISHRFTTDPTSQICRWHKDFLIDFPMMRRKCM
jgi:hypothetical protein